MGPVSGAQSNLTDSYSSHAVSGPDQPPSTAKLFGLAVALPLPTLTEFTSLNWGSVCVCGGEADMILQPPVPEASCGTEA